MATNGGFCPIAKALEIVGERWTLLIIREMLTGSHHFNEIERGLPGISRSLMAQRLRALQRAGLVEKRQQDAVHSAYYLTQAGQELYTTVMELGRWGHRWANHDIQEEDTDPVMLMWDMRRRIHIDRLPDKRVVAEFDFRGAHRRTIWLVLERPEPSVCLTPPGFDPDLLVTADTLSLHRVWMGRLTFGEALARRLVQVDGPPALVSAFPNWFALNVFAHIPPMLLTRS